MTDAITKRLARIETRLCALIEALGHADAIESTNRVPARAREYDGAIGAAIAVARRHVADPSYAVLEVSDNPEVAPRVDGVWVGARIWVSYRAITSYFKELKT